MRRTSLILLIPLTVVITACSFINEFIVVNASDHAIEVRYRLMKPTHPNAPKQLSDFDVHTKPAAQIHKDVAWQPLPSSRYKIDPDNYTVGLTLNPGEALLLIRCRPAGGSSQGDCAAEEFFVEEIALVGGNGEINLKGQQARKSFAAESRHTYTLTYR